MKKLFICLLLIAQSAFGLDVKYIEKNEKVPYTGYLITPETERVFRINNEELVYQTKLNHTYKNIIQIHENNAFIYEKRIENLQKQNVVLVSQQVKNEDNNFLMYIGMFLLGSLATVAVTYGVNQVSK